MYVEGIDFSSEF